MFGKGIRIFSVFGVPIQIDWTFVLVLALFTWIIGGAIQSGRAAFGLEFDMAPLQEGATPYVLGLIIVIGLFVSVLIHEIGHALTARVYGVKTRSITLWLLGGVAQLERMPRERGAEAVVAIAGPITSFALAGVLYLVMVVPGLPLAARYVVTYLFAMNLVLAIFNMLPALPLDGGRVLRSLLALKMDPLAATRITAGISKVLALGLGILGIFSNPWLIFIALFIYMAVTAEAQQSMIEYMLRGIRVRDLMNRDVVSVAPDTSVAELMQMMVRERHLGFPVLDGGQLLGIVDLGRVHGVPPETTVGQIMHSEPDTIQENSEAIEAFMKMSQAGFARLIVVDAAGRMVGIITKTDLMRAIQIRVAATAPVNASPEQVPARDLSPARVMP